MNYDQPRQIADGEHAGKWQYTSANRRTGTHPIGFCWAPGPDSDPNDATTWPQHYHDTEIEARECYASYCRSNIRLGHDNCSWTGCQFKGCDNPARNLASSGAWSIAALCDDHNTIENAAEAMGFNKPAGNSVHS